MTSLHTYLCSALTRQQKVRKNQSSN